MNVRKPSCQWPRFVASTVLVAMIWYVADNAFEVIPRAGADVRRPPARPNRPSLVPRALLRAGADVRQTPAPAAFQSGGTSSEVVLREILATLKTMERRLARIETTITNAAKAKPDARRSTET